MAIVYRSMLPRARPPRIRKQLTRNNADATRA